MRWLLGCGLFGRGDTGGFLGSLLDGGSSNSLTYASINGAIIAIVLAALLGYALIVFQSLSSAEKDLVDSANELLQERYVPGFSSNMGREASEAIRTMTQERGGELLFQATHPVEIQLSEEIVVKHEDYARRGQLIVSLIQAMLFDLVFRESELAKAEDVESWLPRARGVTNSITRVFALSRGTIGLPVGLSGLMAAADAKTDAMLGHALDNSNLTPDLRADLELWVGAHARMLESALDKAEDYDIRLHSLGRQLQHIKRYQKRMVPPRLARSLLCAAVALVFGCGVAAPMLYQATPRLFSVVIPLALYAGGLLLASLYILRKS